QRQSLRRYIPRRSILRHWVRRKCGMEASGEYRIARANKVDYSEPVSRSGLVEAEDRAAGRSRQAKREELGPKRPEALIEPIGEASSASSPILRTMSPAD